MQGLQLAFERDVREGDAPVTAPKPGPEDRAFTTPSERSTDIAPDRAWQAGGTASSDFRCRGERSVVAHGLSRTIIRREPGPTSPQPCFWRSDGERPRAISVCHAIAGGCR